MCPPTESRKGNDQGRAEIELLPEISLFHDFPHLAIFVLGSHSLALCCAVSWGTKQGDSKVVRAEIE